MGRPLELDDIQGNVLAGFNTDVEALVALSVRTPSDLLKAAAWLVLQAPALTTTSQVKEQRARMKTAAADDPLTWLSIAISSRVLKAAQPGMFILDQPFNAGMAIRAPSVLGDKTDAAAWIVGSPEAPVDVLLIVAANREEAIRDRVEDLIASAAASGLKRSRTDIGRRIPGNLEHFGFRDGVSQPLVQDFDDQGTMPAGHFIFGYPRTPGGPAFAPAVDPAGITDNGSLLVYRRLEQDVAALNAFCTRKVDSMAAAWPGLKEDYLAALIVGRWPSGARLTAGVFADPGADQSETPGFEGDHEGKICPFGAHIRKINPRNGPKDVQDIPRMIRRGIPYGPTFAVDPTAKRGLLFLSFQSSIKDQFEFLIQRWANSPQNPGRGNDLLIGRTGAVRSLHVQGPQGEVTVTDDMHEWITPTGGAYLFAPGRSGLSKLLHPAHGVG